MPTFFKSSDKSSWLCINEFNNINLTKQINGHMQ